jgi:hypothetical protein
LFDDLLHEALPCQMAGLILQLCTLPKVNFLARVMPPAVTASALAAFDERIRDTFCRKFGIRANQLASKEVSQIFCLPLRYGGLGYRLQAQVAPFAYLSSVAAAAAHIKQVQEDSSIVAAASTTTDKAIADSYERVEQAGYFEKNPSPDAEKVQLPQRPEEFLSVDWQQAKGLQRILFHDVEVLQLEKLLSTASPQARARILSCGGTGASAWLLAIPTEPSVTMADTAYVSALRFRLGLSPVNDMPAKCVCGVSLADKPDHFLSCISLNQSSISRHNALAHVALRLCREAGGTVQPEPHYATEHVRPDGQIRWLDDVHDGYDFVDVSVVHPGSSFTRVAQKAGGAAKQREAAKRTKYEELRKTYGAEFVPLVFESYGAMGEAAHKFFTKVGTWITAILDTCDQRPFVVQRLSVALQIGNFFIQKDGLIRARKQAAQLVAEAARSTLRRSTWAKAVHPVPPSRALVAPTALSFIRRAGDATSGVMQSTGLATAIGGKRVPVFARLRSHSFNEAGGASRLPTGRPRSNTIAQFASGVVDEGLNPATRRNVFSRLASGVVDEGLNPRNVFSRLGPIDNNDVDDDNTQSSLQTGAGFPAHRWDVDDSQSVANDSTGRAIDQLLTDRNNGLGNNGPVDQVSRGESCCSSMTVASIAGHPRHVSQSPLLLQDGLGNAAGGDEPPCGDELDRDSGDDDDEPPR